MMNWLRKIFRLEPQPKKYRLLPEQIKPLAIGFGGCIATDMITVHGKKVGYMVREKTTRPDDSGWCFTSGEESQEYMDNPENHGIYDLNTIANCCPDIIEHLDAPPLSAFIRDKETGKLVIIEYEQPLQ